MGEPRTRRTAAVTLLLLAVAATVTAAVAWRLKPESAAYWGSAIGGIYGLAALYLAWASYRDDRADAKPALTLPEIADQLAVAVRAQWAAEVELRRLNDPYALPVRWDPAPVDLVEDWAVIERLATGGGAGWPPPPPPGTWATGPAALAGAGGDLVSVLEKVPTGRLVLLGEPGAGKTLLLARLAVDLLAGGRREPGGRVPVLLSLAPWDPSRQRFDDWVESRLVADYSGLAEPAPDADGKTRARRLWETGLLLLLLDGLDEISAPVRGIAVARINDAMPPGHRLVVTSRTGPYRASLQSPGSVEVRLTGAVGIELRPLRADDVADYLRDSAGGATAAARWDPVLVSLTGTPAVPVAQALTTPLMASLARTIYNPRPGESVAAVASSPAELLDLTRFPTHTAIVEHLFDGYLPAAYRSHPDPAQRCRWQATDAERWLIFLARHMESRLGGTSDLAWWQLHAAAPGPVAGFASGVMGGFLALLFVGPIAGAEGGLLVGLMFSLMFGISSWLVKAPDQPAAGLRWVFTRTGLLAGFAAGLVGTAAGVLVARPANGRMAGMTGALGGLMYGFMVGLIVGLRPPQPEPTEAADPRTTLGRDFGVFGTILCTFMIVAAIAGILTAILMARLAARDPTKVVDGLIGGLLSGSAAGLAAMLVATLTAGLKGGLIAGLVSGFAMGVTDGLASGLLVGLGGGLAAGLAAGLAVGLSQCAWGWSAAARCWLAFRGKLPWQVMHFLADAHQQRGVLRQAGAVYQFRHIELQRRLANR